MQKKIAFIFQHSPYGTSKGRELLDLAMVAAAYEQEIVLIFLDEGIYHLSPEQKSEAILAKNYGKTFSALPLYDIETFYVCSEDCANLGIEPNKLNAELELQFVDKAEIRQVISSMDEVICS